MAAGMGFSDAMSDRRPDRTELFGIYYLGFAPDGTYKWRNAHSVAAYYSVSADAILRWLEEYDLSPAAVGRKAVEISRLSVDIQMELSNLTPEGVRERVAEVLEELDMADSSRKPWRDGPIV